MGKPRDFSRLISQKTNFYLVIWKILGLSNAFHLGSDNTNFGRPLSLPQYHRLVTVCTCQEAEIATKRKAHLNPQCFQVRFVRFTKARSLTANFPEKLPSATKGKKLAFPNYVFLPTGKVLKLDRVFVTKWFKHWDPLNLEDAIVATRMIFTIISTGNLPTNIHVLSNETSIDPK